MEDSKLARLLRAHAKIKAQKAEASRVHKKEETRLKGLLATVETALLGQLNESGSDSLKIVGLGMVLRTKKVLPSCRDWGAFWTHVLETGDTDLVQRRLSSTAISGYMEDNEDKLPPGVTIHVERGVTVRRQS